MDYAHTSGVAKIAPLAPRPSGCFAARSAGVTFRHEMDHSNLKFAVAGFTAAWPSIGPILTNQ